MRTINSYISEIKDTVAKDYPNLDDRFVLTLMNQYRAINIKNELNKGYYVHDQLSQTIKGIKLELTTQTMLPFISDDTRILKSNVKLPKLVNLTNRALVLNIFSDKILSSNFNFVTREEAVYSGSGRYNSKDIFCFIYDNYLYVKLKKQNPNINLIDLITFEGIFEQPEECIPLQYSSYFDFLEYEYPISESMWGYIKSSILQNSLMAIQSELNEK